MLCPNVALCQQVLAVASALRDPDGAPLLSAAYVNASNPPPQDPPDIIISTPAAMMGFITGPGPEYGFIWSDEGLPTRVRHLVLDEADMLLGRAFEKPVKQLLQVRANPRVGAPLVAEQNVWGHPQAPRGHRGLSMEWCVTPRHCPRPHICSCLGRTTDDAWRPRCSRSWT